MKQKNGPKDALQTQKTAFVDPKICAKEEIFLSKRITTTSESQLTHGAAYISKGQHFSTYEQGEVEACQRSLEWLKERGIAPGNPESLVEEAFDRNK